MAPDRIRLTVAEARRHSELALMGSAMIPRRPPSSPTMRSTPPSAATNIRELAKPLNIP